MSRSELRETLVPTLGLDKDSSRTTAIGDAMARVKVVAPGRVRTRWNKHEQVLGGAPAAVKMSYASELRALHGNAGLATNRGLVGDDSAVFEPSSTRFISSGSVVRRFMPCGKLGCRCQADPPQLHGPYWQWSRVVGGKTVIRRLTEGQASLYREWIASRRHLTKTLAEMDKVS